MGSGRVQLWAREEGDLHCSLQLQFQLDPGDSMEVYVSHMKILQSVHLQSMHEKQMPFRYVQKYSHGEVTSYFAS
jgi:hypothetical protein